MWAVRDDDGICVLFKNKPKKDSWYGFWCDNGHLPYCHNDADTVAHWKAIRHECDEIPGLGNEPVEVDIVIHQLNNNDNCFKELQEYLNNASTEQLAQVWDEFKYLNEIDETQIFLID